VPRLVIDEPVHPCVLIGMSPLWTTGASKRATCAQDSDANAFIHSRPVIGELLGRHVTVCV